MTFFEEESVIQMSYRHICISDTLQLPVQNALELLTYSQAFL